MIAHPLYLNLPKDYKNIDGTPTKIAILPPIYILGYLDIRKDTFIKNPQFAFDNSNKVTYLSHLKPILDKKYEKVLEKSQLLH